MRGHSMAVEIGRKLPKNHIRGKKIDSVNDKKDSKRYITAHLFPKSPPSKVP
jgi:hypothetical protein